MITWTSVEQDLRHHMAWQRHNKLISLFTLRQNTIWQPRYWSTLAQVMACCMTAPSHYLNQWWLIVCKVQWPFTWRQFHNHINHRNQLENMEDLKFDSHVPGAKELTVYEMSLPKGNISTTPAMSASTVDGKCRNVSQNNSVCKALMHWLVRTCGTDGIIQPNTAADYIDKMKLKYQRSEMTPSIQHRMWVNFMANGKITIWHLTLHTETFIWHTWD